MVDNYWKNRELEHIKKMVKNDKQLAKQIESKYRESMAEIQSQIEAFYGRYADKEGISMEEARKRATKLDIKKYGAKAKKYVKNKTFTKQANEEMRLYNLTMKVNRLQLLKANIALELARVTSDVQLALQDEFNDQARAEYERQAGILGETIVVNEKTIDSIVNASFQNATWSDRLWANQTTLRAELDKLLTKGIVQGKHPSVLARELRKRFNAGTYNTERLMRTELGRIQIQVQEDSFKRTGIDKYMVITEPDACEICLPFDGKTFDLDSMQVGVNAPVFHPNCRCSTAGYVDRQELNKKLKGRGL